jgi:hypothetical protein
MLTLADIDRRERPCRRCKGRFRVKLPSGWSDSQLARLLRENRIAFMRAIREKTGCEIVDAKGTMQHFAPTPGRCHWCNEVISTLENVVDCSRCGSLNLQFRS